MLGLTKRQREIIDFIESYISERRCSPSYREIQDFFGFSSLGSVYNHIQTLKRKGVLSDFRKGARSLNIPIKHEIKTVPLIGKLKGGYTIETFAQITQIPYPSAPDEECYLLEIEGETLLEECLQPGDLVLVVPCRRFEEGEMVIALVDHQTTIVKRAFSEPPYIRFESTNPEMHSLVLREDHIEIQGVIISVFRDFNRIFM